MICFKETETVSYAKLLSRYDLAKEKLTFVMDWINANRNENGQWDFGEKAKDGVYFPLSNRWDRTTRITDSTYRISKLFGLLCYYSHDCSKCVTYIASQTNNDLRRQAQSLYKETIIERSVTFAERPLDKSRLSRSC